MEVMESTEGEHVFLFRLITCCNATTNCDAIKIVSAVKLGVAAWPPLPRIVKYNSSALAIDMPGRKLSLPVSNWGFTCNPKMACGFGFSNTPSLIIRLAPPGF